MLYRLRLLFAGLLVSLALVACGGDESADTVENENDATMAMTEAEPTGETMGDTVVEVGSDDTSAETIEAGMTRAALIEKFGEPSISAERQLDAMQIETLEWDTDDGVATAQLVDGKVTYGRIITVE